MRFDFQGDRPGNIYRPCNNKGTAMDSMSVNDMVAAARTRITGLSKEEMQRELESGEAVIVDIRDVRERWREGTIPGAKHVPRGMLEFWADPQSEYHKRYMN